MKKCLIIIGAIAAVLLMISTVTAVPKTDSSAVMEKNRSFDLKIKSIMRKGYFPSFNACIIKNGSVAWYKGYGNAKFLKKPTFDTVYPVGSISKTFTGTAMMQLYEKKLFDLDDDVNDYLDFKVRNPDFPEVPITFRMLLAHQSSLMRDVIKDWVRLRYWTIVSLKNRQNFPYPMIKELITPTGRFYKPAYWENYAPGSDCVYSNLNYILLEHLVETLSGKSFIDYCQENIFDPLDMKNTGFNFKNFKRSQIATPYQNIGPFYFRIPYIDGLYGAGGIKCSIEDLSHYTIAHMNGGVWNGNRILNESTVELMHSIQYPGSSFYDERFGLGWVDWAEYQGFDLHGHAGSFLGGSGIMVINASNDWAVLFSINKYLFFTNERTANAWGEIRDLLMYKAQDL